MASGGAIRAGRAFIELFTEDSAVGRGLRAASAKMAAWGASVNKLGSSIGDAVGTTFHAMAKGAKIAGFAIAGIGAGLIGAAKLFADADRSTMSGEQAAAADRMKDSFAALMDGAKSLNNTLMTSLQPGIEAVIDIVRVGMNAFRSWVDSHGELLAAVTDFLGGVRDALSAGEIGLAAEIAWAGVKTAWAAGVAWVMDATLGWKTSLQQTLSEAFLGVGKVVSDFWDGIADAGSAVWDFLVDGFQSFLGWLGSAFTAVAEKIGILEEGTFAEFEKQQAEKTDKRKNDRVERDRAIVKKRAQAEEEFGQTVLDANKAIADANRSALDDARADVEAKRQELIALQNKAKEIAKPIETGIKEGVGEKGSVAGAFGGGRMLGQLAGDVSGKSIAESTRETAKQTKRTADAVATMAAREPGLGVT